MTKYASRGDFHPFDIDHCRWKRNPGRIFFWKLHSCQKFHQNRRFRLRCVSLVSVINPFLPSQQEVHFHREKRSFLWLSDCLDVEAPLDRAATSMFRCTRLRETPLEYTCKFHSVYNDYLATGRPIGTSDTDIFLTSKGTYGRFSEWPVAGEHIHTHVHVYMRSKRMYVSPRRRSDYARTRTRLTFKRFI